MTGLVTALDLVANEIRHTYPAIDLPLGGRNWTLRVTDDAVLIEIERATRREPVNRALLPPREPSTDPQPQPQPAEDPPPAPEPGEGH